MCVFVKQRCVASFCLLNFLAMHLFANKTLQDRDGCDRVWIIGGTNEQGSGLCLTEVDKKKPK